MEDRIELEPGVQERLLTSAIAKTGSERALAQQMGIGKGSIYGYHKSHYRLPAPVFLKLLAILGQSSNDMKFHRIDSRLHRIKGGTNSYLRKIHDGTFAANLKRMTAVSGSGLKRWHEYMRTRHPEKYHAIQHARFAKNKQHVIPTLRGEKVRHELERDVADYLYQNGIDYEYEPTIKFGYRHFYPDFRIDNLVVECTAWQGAEKAERLNIKMMSLQRLNYKVKVVIPEELHRFYGLIKEHILTPNEFKSFIKPG